MTRTPLLAVALAAAATHVPQARAQDRPPAPGNPDSGAPAGDQRPMGRRMGGLGMAGLMAADANGDGIVTREEAIAAADARFATLDANHDGQVTADEMAAAMPQRRFAPTGDGGGRPAMTRDDFRARAVRQFDRLDANGDGRIDAAEIANWRETMRERRGGGGGDAPPPGQPPAPPR